MLKWMAGLGLLVVAGVGVVAGAQSQPAGDLKATLAKLDAASAKFTTAEARVHRESYNALIRDVDDRQDGMIYFIREKSGATQMGLKTGGEHARTVEYKNGTIRDFNPAAGCYDTVTRAGIDTYLTLGFGGSGKELARAWDITDMGAEMMGGMKTEHLMLVPKDAAVRNNVSKVELWLSLERDVSVKQIFYSPSKDRNTAVFSSINTTEKPKLSDYSFGGKPCGK